MNEIDINLDVVIVDKNILVIVVNMFFSSLFIFKLVIDLIKLGCFSDCIFIIVCNSFDMLLMMMNVDFFMV